MIELKNVSFKYRAEDEKADFAIKDLNLEIDKGKFVAIVGHNGSGKSTLAKLLNGLILPTSGDVIVDEINTKDETKLLDLRRKVGMVFQNPDNQAVATIVEEDVAFGPENLQLTSSEIVERVNMALEAVDMTEYRDHAPHLLSGGQKQRIAIAGILAMLPDYIVLDESTAMLDPMGRNEIISIVNKLNKEQNKTVILITHHMDEIIGCDKVIVMTDGKKIAEGTPKEIFYKEKEIKEAGLVIPDIIKLSQELKKQGIDIKENILTSEELVDVL